MFEENLKLIAPTLYILVHSVRIGRVRFDCLGLFDIPMILLGFEIYTVVNV